jgi:predicted transcriptional regulator
MKRTITIGITTTDTMFEPIDRAWETGKYQGEFISFLSMDLLWKTFTPRRLELVQAMTGKGPMSLRAAARLVGKDVKTVHGDVHALLKKDILEKTEDGKIVFPYESVHFDFVIPAVAA